MQRRPVAVPADILPISKGSIDVTPRPTDATEVGRGRFDSARLLIALALLAVIAISAEVAAQTAAPTTRSGPSVAPPTPSNGKESTTPERTAPQNSGQPVFGLLQPEDGAVVPLPAGTRYEDFLAWIAARRGPGYGINSVVLSGRVGSDGRAQVDAEVTLVVHRDNEWVRAPLAFGEGVLIGFEHSGEGLASFDSFAKDVGYTWSLQGRGEHRLKLQLAVPLTDRTGETRLVLSTPANTATTKVDLTIPSDPTVTAVGGILRSNFSSDQQTVVEWVGPGGRIELSWRPQVAAAQPADLAAATVIMPSVTAKAVQLRAVQKVSPSQGQVSTVRTRLPAGFALESVTGSLYQSHSEETTETGKVVTVQLAEATGSPFELTYRVSASLPADGIFSVDGFSLVDVPPDAQSGRVQLERSTGYDVHPLDGAQGIEKIEMLEPMPLAVSSAYSFNAQPFHLVLKAEPISPTLAVTPTLQFHVLPERIDLDAEFNVEVRKGELREVRLNWPGSRWSVSPIRAGPIQEFPRTMEAGSPIEIGVPGTTSAFTIPVRASLAREAGSGQITVRLPRLDGTARQKAEVLTGPFRIELESPLDLAVTVSAGGATLTPIDTTRATAMSDDGTPSRFVSYTVPAETTDLVFDLRKLERQVDAVARISLAARGDKLRVREQIQFNVQNQPLSTLRLRVPAALLSQDIEFLDAEDQPLTYKVQEREENGSEVLIQPSSPIVGPFTISTQYDVLRGVTAGEAGEVLVPIVQPIDATHSETALEVVPLRQHRVQAAGAGWVRVQTTEAGPTERWLNAQPTQAVRIKLEPSSEEPAKVVVTRLLQRSLLRRDGNVVTYADIQFAQVPPTIAIRFPEELKPESFAWRGAPVAPAFYSDGNDSIAEIPLAETSGPAVLAIAFKQSGDGLGLASRRTLATLGIDDAAVRETLWQLTLPESQHLFREPAAYEPQNFWSLDGGLIWARHSAKWMDEWFGAKVPRISPEFDAGHVYDFVRAGGPKPLEFSSISRSLVVLIGAGTAILLGYAFANGLILHRRQALIAVVALLLLAWTFFPNQVQIFLLPAIFGLLLVAIAAVAEWLLQRRQDRLAASAQSAVDFVTILPGDGSHSAAPSAIGSEEPTVVRTVRPPEPVGSSHGAIQ